MKKIILLFVVLNSGILFSQTLDDLKKSDTIYFYFNHTNDQKKIFQEDLKKNITGEYYYNYYKNNDAFLMFSHVYHLKQEVKTEKKSFLKKNKKRILDYKFLQKYELQEIIKIFDGNKKVYLIDTHDIKKCKIKLKEVRVVSSLLLEM